jgi:isochorismate synthase EntC
MAKKEPTLTEVLESMNERFNLVFKEFERVHKENKFTQSLTVKLQENMLEVRKQQHADSEVLDEIRDELDSISKAVDKDAVTIVNHERKIAHLQKLVKN